MTWIKSNAITTYEGEWLDDKKSGGGTYTWPNRAKYVGGFVNDKMTGMSSSLAYGDGSFYSGEFKDNKRDGEGMFKFNDGSTY